MADLVELPETVRGEIIDGTLYVHPLHPPWHSSVVGGLLDAVRREPDRPGEWWILRALGIQAEGSPEFVPDFAGWRRERFPMLPAERFTAPPDWVCEILFSSTRSYDQRVKRPFYARIGIRYLWFIDPDARSLTVSELVGSHWGESRVYGEDAIVHAALFEDIALDLRDFWPES